MKKTIIALSIAAMASMGALVVASSANAAGIGHFDCKGQDSYDVMKGKCIATVGATAYSPTMVMYKHKKKHKMMMK